MAGEAALEVSWIRWRRSFRAAEKAVLDPDGSVSPVQNETESGRVALVDVRNEVLVERPPILLVPRDLDQVTLGRDLNSAENVRGDLVDRRPVATAGRAVAKNQVPKAGSCSWKKRSR